MQIEDTDSYLFETPDVPDEDVLTHQFLDQRVGAPVQLSQEAETETLRPNSPTIGQLKATGPLDPARVHAFFFFFVTS